MAVTFVVANEFFHWVSGFALTEQLTEDMKEKARVPRRYFTKRKSQSIQVEDEFMEPEDESWKFRVWATKASEPALIYFTSVALILVSFRGEE